MEHIDIRGLVGMPHDAPLRVVTRMLSNIVVYYTPTKHDRSCVKLVRSSQYTVRSST